MSADRVILFCFAGRRENMELQLPFVHRILAEHPRVECHLWNLARNTRDAKWLQTVTGERLTVINDLHGPEPWKRMNEVYRHYAQHGFGDTTFVKIDDDVVFIQTERFPDLLAASLVHPDHVVSALTVNNGASTPLIPELNAEFDRMNIPLLDVHLHKAFAKLAHEHFFAHWPDMLAQPPKTIATRDWLSINMIAISHDMMMRFARTIGTNTPRIIAGRTFTPRSKMGDEGMANTVPRMILQGMVAAHLTFGPQCNQMTMPELTGYRAQYAEIGKKYLETL